MRMATTQPINSDTGLWLGLSFGKNRVPVP